MRVYTKERFSLRPYWQPLAVLLLGASVALAQAQSASDYTAVDPPSRVARLSYMEGDLGFLPAGAKEWSDASINRPLTTGDRLSTGQDTRAELELGGGTLRIASQTDFGLLNLNDQLAQIELTQGSLNISVRSLDPGQSYEIDTPTVALVLDQPGIFRVDIDGSGQSTEVTALDGDATVYGENSAQRPINAGHSYRFYDSGLINGTITDISGGDAFDAWCSDRDRQYAQPSATQHVSDDVVGYQDLAQYGDWNSDSDYGAVWYPSNVDSNWAPYQDGSWAYIMPWGWSWIDNSRWGFAPYHYGRWAHTHRGWGWIPGPIGVRPIYAPALVAFVDDGSWGGGGHPGYVSPGGAGPIHPIGWFPLGPGEIYNPWYHSSRRYYSNINITNIRVINNNRTSILNNINTQYGHYRNGTPLRGEQYVNRAAPRGLTAVPSTVFAGGLNVRSQLLHVDPRRVADVPVLTSGSVLRPAADAAGPRSEHARSLPLGGFQRNVVARQAPPAAAFGRGTGAPKNLAGSQRAGSPTVNARPGSNVKVLSQHFGNGPVVDQSDVTPAANGRDVQSNPRSFGNALRHLPPTSNVIPNVPAITRRDNAPQNVPYGNNPATQAGQVQNGTVPNNVIQTRQGELPSARFAHPRGSSISNSNDNPSRANDRRTSTLPQVPQIRQASLINQPVPSNNPPPQFQRPENNVAPREFNRPQEQQQMQQMEQQRQQMQAQMQQQMQQRQMQKQQMQQMQQKHQRPQPQTTAPPQRAAPQHAEPRQAPSREDQH